MKRKIPILSLILLAVLAVVVLVLLTRGGGETAQTPAPVESQVTPTLATGTPTPAATAQPAPTPAPEPTPEPVPTSAPEPNLPVEGEYYYDLTNVVLYLELYDALPENYLSKTKARSLGWEGGSVERYYPGGAIGGSRFGNLEGLLPESNGRSYTECDLNTNGQKSRGAERLVFSNDGLYFYTADHYESFTEYVVTEDWEVVPK